MTPRPSRRTFCELGSAGLITWVTGCTGAAGGEQSSGGSTDGTTAADPSSSGAAESSAGTTSSSSSSGESSSTSGTQADESSSTDATSTTGDLCEPSPGSIEGPFYRPGIPIRSDLDLYGDAGTVVHLRGRVLDGDCAPVANAIVELWHASPLAPGASPGETNAIYDAGGEYRYYGQVATDPRGAYAFDTLQPGWYLNGAEYRPAHLHVKVWSADVERLTTQLYFADDPFNAADPWFDPTMLLTLDADGMVERDLVI